MIKIPFLESIQQKHYFLIAALGFITYLFIFIKPPYFGVSDPPISIEAVRFSLHRPITLLLFKCVNPLFKLNPISYYSIGVGLHLCNAILVYNLVMSLAKEYKIALITAAFFLIHYISADIVLEVYQYDTLLSGFFYLISILCFIKSLAVTRTRNTFYVLSLISYLFALGARETALSLPFVILFYDILFMRGAVYPKLKTIAYRHIPYFVITIIIIVLVCFNEWDTYHLTERLNFVRHNFNGWIINYSILMEALFIPFNFHSAPTLFWLTERHNFIISLLIAVCSALLMFSVKSKIYKLSLIWILVTTIPFLLSRAYVKEVYLYLPLIGVCLLFSVVIEDAAERFAVLIKNNRVTLCQNFLIGMILLLFFVSSWGRIISRQRLGEISRGMFATVNRSISGSSKNILIYAFWFPFKIDNFIIGSMYVKEIMFLSRWKNMKKPDNGKIFTSIDCYRGREGNPLEFKDTIYALTLTKTKTFGKLIVSNRSSYGTYKYPLFSILVESIRPEMIGIDSMFQQEFDRYVFYYRDGKVTDLTEQIFPKTRVFFRVKGDKIKKISITGDFNDWDRNDYFLVNSEGIWEKEIFLTPGKYRYKLIIDDNKEISNSDSEYFINDPARGLCSILAVSNNALPIGLLPSRDDRYDAQIIKSKERLLMHPDDAFLHKELADLYKQKGFLREADLEYLVAEELDNKI